MTQRNKILDQPYHIIVEGVDDCALIERLLKQRQIDEYIVGYGQGRDGRSLGKDAFCKRIDAIAAGSTVQVRGYIIVADCDDDPSGRFDAARRQLNRLPKPKNPFETATGTDSDGNEVRTSVVMIPRDLSHGGLETLLLECCNDIEDYRNCVDAFCTCTAREGRRKLDAEKVRLRALIAATHKSDPSISLSYWMADEHRQFGLDNPALDFLADHFRSFKAQ